MVFERSDEDDRPLFGRDVGGEMESIFEGRRNPQAHDLDQAVDGSGGAGSAEHDGVVVGGADAPAHEHRLGISTRNMERELGERRDIRHGPYRDRNEPDRPPLFDRRRIAVTDIQVTGKGLDWDMNERMILIKSEARVVLSKGFKVNMESGDPAKSPFARLKKQPDTGKKTND